MKKRTAFPKRFVLLSRTWHMGKTDSRMQGGLIHAGGITEEKINQKKSHLFRFPNTFGLRQRDKYLSTTFY